MKDYFIFEFIFFTLMEGFLSVMWAFEKKEEREAGDGATVYRCCDVSWTLNVTMNGKEKKCDVF